MYEKGGACRNATMHARTAKYQQERVPCLAQTLIVAEAQHCVLKKGDADHPNITFLRSTIADLDTAISVIAIVNECAMCFGKDVTLDGGADTCQLDN